MALHSGGSSGKSHEAACSACVVDDAMLSNLPLRMATNQSVMVKDTLCQTPTNHFIIDNEKIYMRRFVIARAYFNSNIMP